VTIADSDVDDVRLNLTSGATLRGVIRTEGSISLSSVRISLLPLDGGLVGAYSSPLANPDGTLEFSGLPDGSYLLRAFGLPQNAYVKSTTLGGQDVLDSEFEISGGEPPGSTLNVVLSARGGQVDGTVTLDGKPLADAPVTLLPADTSKLASAWWFKSTTSDGNGNFALLGVRPGDYRVFAWQKIDPDEEHDPAFLDNFKDGGQEIQVAPGASLNLQLGAIPASQTQAVEAQ
jgi:hypothetical protein